MFWTCQSDARTAARSCPHQLSTMPIGSQLYSNRREVPLRLATLTGRHVKRRRLLGQTLVELAIGLIALVPVVLVVFDLAVIVIAVQQNDAVCREAARAAAAGNPNDVQQRASAIVAKANLTAHGILSNYKLLNVSNTVDPAYLVSISQYGGPVNGNVTVQTQVDVRPFVVQWAFNGKTPLQFVSQQTFPFTYQMPNVSGNAAPSP